MGHTFWSRCAPISNAGEEYERCNDGIEYTAAYIRLDPYSEGVGAKVGAAEWFYGQRRMSLITDVSIHVPDRHDSSESM